MILLANTRAPRTALLVDSGMDFRSPVAARTAIRLRFSPFFHPPRSDGL